MPTTYTDCDEDVLDLASKIQHKFHADLDEAKVSIRFLFAHPEFGFPAIKHHGWPAKALVKITSLRDRAAGLDDVILLIDATTWETMPTPKRAALIDHELTHLEVRYEKSGAVMYDDLNRPKLRIRPHDFQFGGFHEMAERYKENSHEVEAVQAVHARWKQMELAFME